MDIKSQPGLDEVQPTNKEDANAFTIFINAMDVKEITLEVDPSDTIEKIKLKIQDKIGIPAYLQRIIIKGKPIDNEQTLSDYNIMDRPFLHLQRRLLGGGDVFPPLSEIRSPTGRPSDSSEVSAAIVGADDHGSTGHSSNPVITATPSRFVSTKTMHIDEEGGEITLQDVDITLKIPKGALPSGGKDISLTVDSNEEHPPFQDNQLVIGPVISCDPDGQIFKEPVTLSVPFSGLNITPKCLQVWSANSSSDSSWVKEFDGTTETQNGDVQVIIEGNRIKFRVTHFTLYAILTAPVHALENWLYPTLQLDILAYIYPVNVAIYDHVLLRIYALRTDDIAKLKLVENTENNTEGSGTCIIPSAFLLKPLGKGLEVLVKNLFPENIWEPIDDMTGKISYNFIQTGGLGARCEVKFKLKDIQNLHREKRFQGAFELKQDGNAADDVERVHFYDEMARLSAAKVANQQAIHPGLHPLQQAERPHGEEGTDVDIRPRMDPRQRPLPPDGEPFARGIGRDQPQQEARFHDRHVRGASQSPLHSQTQIPQLQLNPSGNLPLQGMNRDTTFTVMDRPMSASGSSNPQRPKVKPLLVACRLKEQDKSSSTIIHYGDWAPFLKTVARRVRPRWQEIAAVLHFTPEECKEFKQSKTTRSPPWWPAFKMLEAWRATLPKCQPEQLKNILADAVFPFDEELGERIRSSEC